MFLRSRLRRLLVLFSALAVLNGAAASAWTMPVGSETQAEEHCRTMRTTDSGVQHCRQSSMMACCRDGREQPDATLPQMPAASSTGGADAAHPLWVSPEPNVSLLHVGSAWYARPPTHGYSSQSLRLLQSVILI
jgi:hypothetical protein